MTSDPPDVSAALLLFARGDVGSIDGWVRVSGGRIADRGYGIDTLTAPIGNERLTLVMQGAAAQIEADLLDRWIDWAAGKGLDPDHIVPLSSLVAARDAKARRHDPRFRVDADLAALIFDDEPVRPMDDAGFQAALPAALLKQPIDLRQGRAVRRSGWRGSAAWRRRMARYAVALLLLIALAPVARIGRMAFEAWRFESAALHVARRALGDPGLAGDPHAALRDRLIALHGPGMGFSAAAAVLFDAVARTPDVELSGLSFDRGMIVAGVTSTGPADLARLVERIGQRGLIVETMPGAGRGSSVLRIRQP